MEYDKINNKIFITDSDSTRKEYEIIACINNQNGNYLVYTDGKQLQNGDIAMYVNCLVEENGVVELVEVTEEELMKVIENLKERLASNG